MKTILLISIILSTIHPSFAGIAEFKKAVEAFIDGEDVRITDNIRDGLQEFNDLPAHERRQLLRNQPIQYRNDLTEDLLSKVISKFDLGEDTRRVLTADIYTNHSLILWDHKYIPMEQKVAVIKSIAALDPVVLMTRFFDQTQLADVLIQEFLNNSHLMEESEIQGALSFALKQAGHNLEIDFIQKLIDAGAPVAENICSIMGESLAVLSESENEDDLEKSKSEFNQLVEALQISTRDESCHGTTLEKAFQETVDMVNRSQGRFVAERRLSFLSDDRLIFKNKEIYVFGEVFFVAATIKESCESESIASKESIERSTFNLSNSLRLNEKSLSGMSLTEQEGKCLRTIYTSRKRFN